jgi:16S rRNA (adenine1518-N6/adenine1519-N6)-dimethyltransferase
LNLKKNLGQHFLHNENICGEIIAALDRQPGLQLLEIGPGGGALTKYLLDWKDTDYRAIEVDEEKVRYLIKRYPIIKDKVLHLDFLKADPPFKGPFSIIGNFPYNISSSILFKILNWEGQVKEMVGMFQKEVALRVASSEGKKAYGILSVLMQAFYKVEYLFDVAPAHFTPPPKVDSGVLRLRHSGNPYRIEDKKAFIKFIKLGFSKRRKTLRNALKSNYPPELLLGPAFDKRAEQLPVAEWVTLFKTFNEGS